MSLRMGPWSVEGMDGTELQAFEPRRHAEKVLKRIREASDLAKALRKMVDGTMKEGFLPLLGEAGGTAPCPACTQVIELLAVAQLKKHAWGTLGIPRSLALRLRGVEPEEFAEDVAYQVLPRGMHQVPALLNDYRREGLDSTHAYNKFNRYCRSAAVRETNRHYQRLGKRPETVLARDPERPGDPPDPQAGDRFQVVETLTDLERWVEQPNCPVSRSAWRKFQCHRVQGITAAAVARMFNTTEGAIHTNTSRVAKALRESGLLPGASSSSPARRSRVDERRGIA